MALDKQSILNELGSVMNKLQSADCGCMGKLFSNQGQYGNHGQGGQGGAAMGAPLPTCGGCRRGTCHGHGYGGQYHQYGAGAPGAGEPFSMNSHGYSGMPCNPTKMYADTYNYLNTNLMQPVVNEVYQDLKSINPTNTVMNNPMATKMGLSQPGGGAGMPGNMGMAQNQMPGSDMGGGMQDPNMTMQMSNHPMGHQQMGQQQMGQQQMENQQMSNQQMGNQQMSPLGNMGANIVNMMTGDSKMSGKTSHVTPMAASVPQGQVPGDMGQCNTGMGNNAAAYGGQQVQSQYMQQPNQNNGMNPNSQNAMSDGNMQQNMGHPGAAYKVNYSNPAAQQMSANRGRQTYGQHTPGIMKFNEMFPGVMGGDLGFDPMSIAIQMNPANQQQAAMSQMQKLMDGKPIEKALQPTVTAAQAASAATNPPSDQQSIPPSTPMSTQPGAPQQNLQQGYTNAAANQPNQGQQIYGQVPQQQQQQVYTAVTGAPTINQNQPPQQYQQQPPQQYQQQQNVDPNAQQYQQQQQQQQELYSGQETGADPNVASNQQAAQGYSAPPTPTPDQMIMEPIFPADTSRNQPPAFAKQNKQFVYNTLGQPVEMLPASLYHPVPDNNTQQTLSPQPVTKMRNDQSRFLVKNTVSKTSLMGNRPVGKTPSKSQLQHIYNQYKGSHSYTQQNVRNPAQGGTFSEGKINVAMANSNQHSHAPVEKVGGDTLANNQAINDQIPVKGQPMGHTGDVSRSVDNKPHGDVAPAKEIPMKRTRNGLQDLVYTSYPTSAAWSFHGENNRSPFASAGHHFRRV